jgi:hypothetical protein
MRASRRSALSKPIGPASGELAASRRRNSSNDHLGSFTPGKYADLAVLSHDYLTVPEQTIRKIESVLTLVGGGVVHAQGSFAALRPKD